MMIAAIRAGNLMTDSHMRIGDRLALDVEVAGLGVDEHCRALVGWVVRIDANEI